jgi:hypothetical protein
MAGRLTDIFAGLQEALTAVNGVLVADHIPEKIVAPMAVVALDRVEYPAAMAGGSSTWFFLVSVLVKRQETLSAQLALDEFLSWDGDRSIRSALAADRTLGGACHSLLVEAADNIRPVESDDGQFLAVDFVVRVHA